MPSSPASRARRRSSPWSRPSDPLPASSAIPIATRSISASNPRTSLCFSSRVRETVLPSNSISTSPFLTTVPLRTSLTMRSSPASDGAMIVTERPALISPRICTASTNDPALHLRGRHVGRCPAREPARARDRDGPDSEAGNETTPLHRTTTWPGCSPAVTTTSTSSLGPRVTLCALTPLASRTRTRGPDVPGARRPAARPARP